ncbi:MAG: LuxR C-terminal-related transcriptional regulator [Bacteroidales bacterium]|nr:LuxR C-terminal-related transcriptional regulator [Bacteroidales bacterium]MEE0903480.1 LuxR C-terminal-related transcriptional regulator [Prevotellamassilia sp.]
MIRNHYQGTDRMSDVICDEPALLQMMSRFGIPLGVADKTVTQVCQEHHVDTATFLALANFMKQGARGAAEHLPQVSVAALTDYLRRAHTYFLDYQLPAVRRKLLEALDCSQTAEVSLLIIKFYDNYMGEVRKHMQHENRKVFGYVEGLLRGERTGNYSIADFARSHSSIDVKLQELKNIIIKYYAPTEQAELLHSALYDIFTCEKDLRMHCQVEDDIFVPAVQILENQVALTAQPADAQAENKETAGNVLSEREQEIVHWVVCGLSNKQIGERLFISPNTVLTHRKNIARKLDIHSVAGLTIYAIVNGIVEIGDIGHD